MSGLASWNAVRNRFHEAFAWWLSELQAMVPPTVRRWFAAPGPELIVDLDGEGLTLRRRSGDEDTELGRLALGTLPAAGRREQLATLLPDGAAASVREAILRLPPARVLRKRIMLPLAAAEDLREVLSLDMDRQTPFPADQVYFDYAVQDIDRKEARIVVDLVAAPRRLVEEGLSAAGGIGLNVRRVEVAWPGGNGPTVDLLPESHQPSRPKLLRPLTVGLGALAVGLAVLAIAIPLQQRHAIVEELSERVAEQRKRAEVAQRLEKEIGQLAQQNRFILDLRANRPLMVDVLDSLTTVVPDDTWLFRVRTSGTEVQIFGYSTSATALIGLIEQAPLFRDAQFRAPLTRDARNDAERLHIGFRFNEGGGA